MNKITEKTKIKAIEGLFGPTDEQALELAVNHFGSAARVAAISGVSEQNFAAMRRGKRQMPFHVFAIAYFFGYKDKFTFTDVMFLYLTTRAQSGPLGREMFENMLEPDWQSFTEWLEVREKVANLSPRKAVSKKKD